MYRSALVALRPDASNQPLLDYAIQLAKRYSIHLSGTSILDRDLLSPPAPVPIGGMAFKIELDEARIARAREQMESIAGEFERSCAEAGVSFDVACSADALCPEISRAVQRHDILLLGHTEEATPSGPRRDSAALQLILQRCPGAAIVVPDPAPPTSASVVVAYDGSLQASRALKSFIASGFFADSPIHVVALDENVSAAEQFASIAADLLKRHGYQAFAAPSKLASGDSAADLIQASCQTLGAQLLVMGAYGKPTIREFFLGTVTKRLLAQSRIPMFIDH
jgi:nucleotide-binding universal stress UspA family protein